MPQRPSAQEESVAQTGPADPPGDPSVQAPDPTVSAGRRSHRWLVVEPRSGDSGHTAASGSSPVAEAPAASDAPAVPDGSGSGRRVVYDISAQRVWLVADDDVADSSYLVSGSRRGGLLVPGSYTVYSRSRHAVSYNHKETMNYMVRFAHGEHAAIGFHDIPALVSDGSLVQSPGQLGTPLSAGCVRQRSTDAQAMWEFADVGTTVVVVA